MTQSTIGNALFLLVNAARNDLFNQGELAQLTYGAFDVTATKLNESQEPEIEISFPVGYRLDRTAILSTRKYTKAELLTRYQFLALQQMPINGLAQLVTITEALLGDIVRAVIVRYPQKLGGKRSMQLHAVLEAKSLEEVHLRATDALLNELSYKSPVEFAASLEDLLSIKLFQCPAFHRYVELKATRDIHVHNRGVANEVYLKKVGSHARAKNGMPLPVDISYFLESYESCLQLTEWLETELNDLWHSSERDENKSKTSQQKLPPQLIKDDGESPPISPGISTTQAIQLVKPKKDVTVAKKSRFK